MVAIDGDTIAVAAMTDSCECRGLDPVEVNNAALYSGAVYVFRGSGSTWSQEAFIKASNSERLDRFDTIALRGNLLVVGAWGEASADVGVGADPGDNTAADAGAAYIYRRTGTAWSETDYLKASNTAAGAGFGHGTAISTDGVVIGSPDSANGGSFYIFR